MTPVCVSVADVARELASIRRLVSRGLGPDVLVVGTGAHALTRDPGPMSSAQRYRRLAAEHPWAARNVLTCGLHVHVAVSGADRALAVYNALRSYLPELLALGANAPYYGGEDSGLATVRAKLNQSWPRAGRAARVRELARAGRVHGLGARRRRDAGGEPAVVGSPPERRRTGRSSSASRTRRRAWTTRRR